MIARRMALVVVAAVLAAGVAGAGAQERYPAKPIWLIVPFDAGGGTDQVARAFAEALKEQLGQPIAVQNISGAGGAIGTTRLHAAAPDGYTLGMGGGFLVSASLRGALKVPATEFTHRARLSQEAFVLGVPAASPYRTLQDVLAAARQRPGEIGVGTAGAGALTHLAAQAVAQATGTRLNIVPFSGGARLLTAVLGGHVDSGVFSQVEVLPQVGPGGRIRVLAVFPEAPSDKLPGVPTLTSAGIAGARPCPHSPAAPSAGPPSRTGV
ncbi:MAG: tripartite tricarboxylate transporter substrate binding protein [Pseudomonadota bacterium]